MCTCQKHNFSDVGLHVTDSAFIGLAGVKVRSGAKKRLMNEERGLSTACTVARCGTGYIHWLHMRLRSHAICDRLSVFAYQVSCCISLRLR